MSWDAVLAAAASQGARTGKGAASWVLDGNSTRETAEAILRMLEDGDPAIDSLVSEPNFLSGEWAGESVPELLGDLIEAFPDSQDEIMDQYEEAAREAFWHEVERKASVMVEVDLDAIMDKIRARGARVGRSMIEDEWDEMDEHEKRGLFLDDCERLLEEAGQDESVTDGWGQDAFEAWKDAVTDAL
jgi:hypothetical protein